MNRSGAAVHWTLSRTTYAVIITAGTLVVLFSVPSAVRFLPDAPREFWLLSILALVIEFTPLVIPHDQRQPSRPAVSLCLTFAMLLLWGPAVAIVVQVVALGVAALRVRQPLRDFALDAARFSLAFMAAGWAEELGGIPRPSIGMDIAELGTASVIVTALVWFLVDIGVILLLLTVSGERVWRAWMGPPLYYYLAANAALLTLAPVLITAPRGWTVGLLAVPLALFGLVSHQLRVQEGVLNRDPVTGQQSLRGLTASVERLMTTGAPTADPPRLGVLLVRLSGLGEVMNVFGRVVTDHLVREGGARIATVTSSEDAVIGRVAAADFVIVLPGADATRAQRVADAVAHELLAPIDVDGVVFNVRPTIGVAIAPEDGVDIGALTARAETAIMDARRTGSPVDTAKTGDQVEAERRLTLLVDLRAAIEQPGHSGELFAVYQPQVRISDGQLVGVEALIRWQHPDRGFVDPAEMIMPAEASGVIHLLTLRVIDDVLAQVSAWSADGLNLRASVNVSAKDFSHESFADDLRQRLDRHAVTPEQLGLEITESALAAPVQSVDRTIADVAAMGIGLSLDDFGTGFASLQQLRRYPLRELKIDRSYIAAMATSSADRALIASISQLALGLGLRVVAEGVEDAATAAALGEMGSIIGQGWYYGRPMTALDLVEWIRARPDRT